MKLEREYKEVFDFYAGASNSKENTVSFEQLLEIIDKIEIDVTREEVKDILRSINDEDTENITYSSFVELFDKRLYSDVTRHDAVEAFRLFDKENSGKIAISDFRHVLSNLSDNLTSVEINQFLKLADTNDVGVIHYKEFVDMLKGE